ncbi:hypothetical protein HFP51_02980 [Parasphingopyxis sp. CP4]|uniref:hypothetical protein n=1 Tax=Parasphingopyxis sp. CP4 TaxID=2724527 RepID=UPI0015A20D43|nr:hypothetical protein [Parasphingopyxis sp. CP4]QLC21240.1 hypothetical protein HFP51_02980 [Parasphingopyxis sp. CP4]
MRLISSIFLAVLLLACAEPDRGDIERIEIRESGWSSTDIEIDRSGAGQYHRSEPFPDGSGGSFSISHEEFSQLVRRLDRYRRQAVPVTDESIEAFIHGSCSPADTENFVYDAGALWIRWVGPGFDEHYLADFECDPDRYGERNADLGDILQSLPITGRD